MSTHPDLVDAVRTTLAAHADPHRAIGQQQYMKSQLPYRGLTTPALRAVLRPVLADDTLALRSRQEWETTIRTLWDEAAYREEWYAALTLARHPRYRAWRDGDAMELWRYLVVTGGWWDVVDDIATHLVREQLVAQPETEPNRLREWAVDPNLWVRRTAIICQTGLRERLDRALLVDAIEANLVGEHSRDFFIRKAIGWALRDHAGVAPDWVRSFVGAHGAQLSGVSRREAMRHLAPA